MVSLPKHTMDELAAGKVSAAKNLGKDITWEEATKQVENMLQGQNRYRALKRWEQDKLIRWDSRGQGKWVVVKTGEEFWIPEGEVMTEPSEGFFANIALGVGGVGG